MPFANAERVIYNKNPLIEVVCQLRFPRILSISETQPASFQERIREKYPLYNVSIELQQQFTEDFMNNEVLHHSRRFQTQSEGTKNYRFSSADNNWHIHLTNTFLALSTAEYVRWEDFLEKLREPLAALVEIYNPAFYERIGLRYVDAFRRSELGLDGVDWSELIHPSALGFLSNDQIKQNVNNYNSFTELDIENGATAQIKTALGWVGSIENGLAYPHSELSFIIDSDMFFMRKSIDELDESLNYLHNVSTKLIRAIITEKLHNAMKPSGM